MRHQSLGEVLVSLASSTSGGADWIKITPRGKVTTRDGPAYEFDPEGLVARFKTDGINVAIDLDHGIARLASQGHTVPAVGWVEELQARPDGLYGRVDWLDAGKAVLAARSHRYVSPTFHHESGKATWLHSVALVTAPALGNMPALANAAHTNGGKPVSLAAIAESLSLPPNSSEADMLAKIAALRADATGGAALPGMMTSLTAMVRKENERTVEDALKRGVIVPAAKDWALAKLAADPNFMKEFEAVHPASYAHLGAWVLEGKMPQSEPMDAGTGEEADRVAAALGIDPARLKGEKN